VIRRIVMVVLVIASLAMITNLQQNPPKMSVSPEPIFYFVVDR
jgi:hypothetical protein